jgi:hypothetical protein
MTMSSATGATTLPPLTDPLITAVGRLVDDHQSPREPSHETISSLFRRAGLMSADPPTRVGKRKRVRAVLGHAIEHNETAGRRLVGYLIGELRGNGGFRPTSPNYVGDDAIENARQAFREEGYDLAPDGALAPVGFDGLTGQEATDVLRRYASRAARAADDTPLVVGTSKDFLEATAAHVLVQHYGTYDTRANFPTLLGQAFAAMSLDSIGPPHPGEPPQRRVERSYYEAACAVNALRNKQGTGHGHPWGSTITENEARAAIRTMGFIADLLLSKLDESRP